MTRLGREQRGWHADWRAPEPRADFATRVLARYGDLTEEGGEGEGGAEERGAHQRSAVARAAARRRWSRTGLCLAALCIGSVAAATLAERTGRARLIDSAQEAEPPRRSAPEVPRLVLPGPRAPMEPEVARSPERPPARRQSTPPDEAAPTPPPLPIHYPPCHCSSGAIVCSCVDGVSP